MARFPNDPMFGETTALRVAMADNDGAEFSISGATVTIRGKSDGQVIRSAVACTVNNRLHRASYLETFTADNGYASGGRYIAIFVLTTADGFVEKYEAEFSVIPTSDV